MRVREDGALCDGVAVPAAKAEGEPVANRVSDGVPVGSDDEPVFVVADDRFELALCLSFGPAACALERLTDDFRQRYLDARAALRHKARSDS